MRGPWPTGGCCTKWRGKNLITDTTTTLLYLQWTISSSLSYFKHPQGLIVINSGTFIVDSTPISRILCLTSSELIMFYSTFTYCKNVTQMRFYKYFMYQWELALTRDVTNGRRLIQQQIVIVRYIWKNSVY